MPPRFYSESDSSVNGEGSPPLARRQLSVEGQVPEMDSPLQLEIGDALIFLRAFFGEETWTGYALIWTRNPRTNEKRSHWFKSLDDAEQGILRHQGEWRHLDVYVGMGMSGPDIKVGKGPGDLSPQRRLLSEPSVDKATGAMSPAPAVWYIPGMWADIDYGDEGHKGGTRKVYAPDEATVLERLPRSPIQPRMVINSGHGIQVFWRFDGLVDISGDRIRAKGRQAGWINLLQEEVFAPYDLDPVIDLARVMRLPGFINNKVPGHPILARIILDDGPTTTPEVVDAILAPRTGDGSTGARRARKTRKPAADSTPHSDTLLDAMRFYASYENYPVFARTWDGIRPGMEDQSPSGYDIAMAHAALELEWPHQKIIELMIARRRKTRAGDKPARYYEHTLRKAVESREVREARGARFAAHNETEGKGGYVPPDSSHAERKKREQAAVQELIRKIVDGEKVIYWLQDFYELRGGIWRVQDQGHFEKQIHKVISEARGGGHEDAVFRREDMASYVKSLAVSVSPPCIDTHLLHEEHRLANFNLDTGELLAGAAFTNGVLTVGEDGAFQVIERDPRHFYTTSRPYRFPTEAPPRPKLFDDWLLGRLPDEQTRTAFWEVMGATICEELHALQRLIALLGGGRTGKGTALRTVAMLIGRGHTVTFSSGPARMAKSQFSLSGLARAVLVLLPDMPRPPAKTGFRMDQLLEGLSTLKSISGGDPITVEQKNKDPISVTVRAGIWLDSNFEISSFIQGQDDAFSWEERIIPIPFLEQLNEEERLPDYENRFYPELEQIAWYAVEAYSRAKGRGAFTWSSEMRILQLRLSQGPNAAAERFCRLLHFKKDAWTTRKEVRRTADDFIGEKVGNLLANRLYSYCSALIGVSDCKRNGDRGFINLGISKPSPE